MSMVDPDTRALDDATPAEATPITAEVSIESLAERVTLLEEAFRRFAGTRPELTVDVVGRVSGHGELVHPLAGFTVRMERAGSGGVALYVTAGYGELTRWRRPGLSAAGALRERFRVRLVDAFGWGESVFPDAESLAHALIGYMQYNLDAVA
jgi:hypothetical protein